MEVSENAIGTATPQETTNSNDTESKQTADNNNPNGHNSGVVVEDSVNAILLAEDESGYRAYDYELDDDSFEIDVYDGKNVKVNYEINLAGDTILDKEQDDMDDDDGKAVRDATVSMVEAVNSQVSGNSVKTVF